MKEINYITSGIIISCFIFCSAEIGAQVTGSNKKTVKPEKIQVQNNSIWPRPTIVPVPYTTVGVKNSVISLSGTWKINVTPPDNYWENSINSDSWQDILVPATASSQGISARGNYVMRKLINIPSDFKGKRIILRLDGIPGTAKLYVNGKYIRDHSGGFTAWSADITEVAAPGEDAMITLGFAGSRGAAGGSFSGSGICRDVKLLCVPEDFIYRFNIETDLDKEYHNATLKVWIGMEFHSGKAKQFKLTLKDQKTESVILETSPVKISMDDPEFVVSFPVPNPMKWDDEHPNLYILETQTLDGGKVTGTIRRKIGFIKIEKADRNILVNGKVVKVHGVDRHDITPLTGRGLTEKECWEDARILRNGNINIVRTSHYPTMEAFLDACDSLGIYVDSETNIAFEHNLQNNPEYKSDFLDQWSEMIERDRSHPCILMWSMGNETSWGRHINSQLKYVREEDKSRPIIFSWAHRAPLSPQQENRKPFITLERPFDIYSLHYAYYDSKLGDMSDISTGVRREMSKNFSREQLDLTQKGFPVFHDESTHVPNYDLAELYRDPNTRNFWGETIKQFWENLYPTEGAMGMAIWAGIDNFSIIKGQNSKRTNSWGIIDGWRREKPEYWLAKEAFSPIRIENKTLVDIQEGCSIEVPVMNWFNHTNLSEVEIYWKVGIESGKIMGPNLEPGGAKGKFTIAANHWVNGDTLALRFYQHKNVLVDEFHLTLNPKPIAVSEPQGPAPRIVEDNNSIIVSNNEFSLTFSKETGLITNGTYQGKTLINSGPYLHLGGIRLPDWTVESISANTDQKEVIVDISGRYGVARVSFKIRIDGTGLMKTVYNLIEMPYFPPVPEIQEELLSPSIGGYYEVGVSYILSNEIDQLSWRRNGIWSWLPDDHIGRNIGTAMREGRGSDQPFGVKPTIPWSEDERDYELFGMYDIGQRGTKDFRSMKENIYQAIVGNSKDKKGIRVESMGTDAIRLKLMDDPEVLIDDRDQRLKFSGSWAKYQDDYLDYMGTLSYSNTKGDAVEFTFQGTGVAWIGSRDVYHGSADVYIDDVLQVKGLDTRNGNNMDNIEGQEKESRIILFSKEKLSPGEHNIKIVVNGDNSDNGIKDGYISIDAFYVLGTGKKAKVEMIVCNKWNYPDIGYKRWGNYAKDEIFVGTGYENNILMKFTGIK
jgi:hypothetical protein